MFDLQPPRHISTLRNPVVAAGSGEGLLAEPTTDAQPRRWELLFMPLGEHLSWLVFSKPISEPDAATGIVFRCDPGRWRAAGAEGWFAP